MPNASVYYKQYIMSSRRSKEKFEKEREMPTVVKKNSRPIQMRTFQCPDCGTKLQATKTKFKTKAGHIKTMYCYVCKEMRDCVQTE